MWLTPNPLPQQRLAQDLASLIPRTLIDSNILPFLDSFWETLGREWGGIDYLRMNKYMYLARLMLREEFAWLKKKSWDIEFVKCHNTVMEKTPLNLDNAKIPDGLRYHVLDVFVDELEEVGNSSEALSSETQSIPPSTLQKLLEPIERLSKRSRLKTVRKRAGETLTDERLNELYHEHSEPKSARAEQEPVSDDYWSGFEDD